MPPAPAPDGEPVKKKRPYHRKRREPKRPRTTPDGGHVPVLLAEVLAALNPQPGGVYVDCTLGYAGHARAILTAAGPTGRLIALDLDPANIARAPAQLDTLNCPYSLRHANFAMLATVLAEEGIDRVDGILADLGMSSMQVDDRERGFSFLRDGPLDMRMDPTRGRTAAELLNSLSSHDLAHAFTAYGDEPAAEAIADAIVAAREAAPIARTHQLVAVIEAAAPVCVVRGPGRLPARKQRLQPLTRVFQALRILVNRELASLEHLLRVAPTLLKPGGTLAVISFHSGEDRLVKASLRNHLHAGTYAQAADDPARPTEAERVANPRSRSAKLRTARTPVRP